MKKKTTAEVPEEQKAPVAPATKRQLELIRPIVFLDAETTGTKVKEDNIVSLHMVKLNTDGDREIYSTLVKPEKLIPEAAIAVHGITNQMVEEAPMFKDIARAVLLFISQCDIAGFNSNRFDVPLLYNELKKANFIWNWKESFFLDIGNIYKIKEPRTLSAAHKFYIGTDIENAHDACADVEATINVLTRQLERYGEDPDFKELDSVEKLALFSNFNKPIVDLSGTFSLDSDGDIIFNFGKHSGEKAKLNKSYLTWMMKPTSNFDSEVLEICHRLLYHK